MLVGAPAEQRRHQPRQQRLDRLARQRRQLNFDQDHRGSHHLLLAVAEERHPAESRTEHHAPKMRTLWLQLGLLVCVLGRCVSSSFGEQGKKGGRRSQDETAQEEGLILNAEADVL